MDSPTNFSRPWDPTSPVSPRSVRPGPSLPQEQTVLHPYATPQQQSPTRQCAAPSAQTSPQTASVRAMPAQRLPPADRDSYWRAVEEVDDALRDYNQSIGRDHRPLAGRPSDVGRYAAETICASDAQHSHPLDGSEATEQMEYRRMPMGRGSSQAAVRSRQIDVNSTEPQQARGNRQPKTEHIMLSTLSHTSHDTATSLESTAHGSPFASDSDRKTFAKTESLAASEGKEDEEDLKTTAAPASSKPRAKVPSVLCLLRPLKKRDYIVQVIPAIILSIIRGAAPPLSTRILGSVFNAFSSYSRASISPAGASQADRDYMRQHIQTSAFQLIGLGAGTLLFGAAMMTVWISVGEKITSRIRLQIFDAVKEREMEWFDRGMGADEDDRAQVKGVQASIGAAGLMARFTRNTDDIRMAMSQQAGQFVQHVITCVACLGVAFAASWSLTLVILASVPISIVVTGITMKLGHPFMIAEFAAIEKASGQIERAMNAITTVKAFNAVPEELVRFGVTMKTSGRAYMRYCYCWSSRLAMTDAIMLSMFVQGFWYGTHLVQRGELSSGSVMTVFWAALMASTNFSAIMNCWNLIEKGKIAYCNIDKIIRDEQPKKRPTSVASGVALPVAQLSHSPIRARAAVLPFEKSSLADRGVLSMRKVRPDGNCRGEISLRHIDFAYPSRPDVPALKDVTMFFPAQETTYIVGGSGSGKSTIAQLLLRLYRADSGVIEVDSCDLTHLDPDWCRERIAAVSQTSIVFDMTIKENVALGVTGSGRTTPVTDEQIATACRVALLHDFVQGLPDGYETSLGAGGADLSGGQKQRLALARGVLRDPPILVLDEATSALDPTSRILVHEAVKRFRRGKTTIIITHDLSQVGDNDFVYVMSNGAIAQQGYRENLAAESGVFKDLLHALQKARAEGQEEEASPAASPTGLEFKARQSLGLLAPPAFEQRDSARYSRLSRHFEGFAHTREMPPSASTDQLNTLLDVSGNVASSRRPHNVRIQRMLGHAESEAGKSPASETTETATGARQPAGVWSIIKLSLKLVPNKPLLTLGFVVSTFAGAVNPAFSIILGQLVATMGTTVPQSRIVLLSLIVLALALADGALIFIRYWVLETAADQWVQSMRSRAYRKILLQHKSFFDEAGNSAQRMCQSIAKDGEDARRLIGQCLGGLWSAVVLVVSGLVLALAFGWQITLVGIGFAFVLFGATAVQTNALNRLEGTNKVKRESVAKRFYDLAANVRGIRAMALEPVLVDHFETARNEAYRSALRQGPVTGLGLALAEGLTYLTEAAMYSLGALLMAKGVYDLQRLLITLNLIIFACTFSATAIVFMPIVAKAVQAVATIYDIMQLPEASPEGNGTRKTPIAGHLTFDHVGFAYSSRTNEPVLKDVWFRVQPGERVAIVGGSGCGKSTVAALLQRLYEPSSGAVMLDGRSLSSYDCAYLREHIAVVSQNPNLFDASIAENIAYGANRNVDGVDASPPSQKEIEDAARAANVHDFIASLPQGYNTNLGSNASLVSGGQAQRLAIARALVRKQAKILLLDECTSALDTQNQVAVMASLLGNADTAAAQRARGMTTVVITHKKEVMQMCDRIVVLKDGVAAQNGSYDQLIRQKGGAFAELASAGEWGV